MRLPLVAMLFALIALDCGGYGTEYDVFVLDDTPPAWVNEAAAEWHTFTGVTLRLHYPPGTWDCTGRCITVRLGTPDELKQMCPPNAVGCTYVDWAHDVARVLLDKDLTDGKGQAVTIHEFGHALGLEHACFNGSYGGHPCPRLTADLTIMNPIVGASSWHVACDDVHQYDELRGWGGNRPCADPRLSATGLLHLADP